MNGPKTGHNLIEHILAPQDSQDIQATHEIINFMDEMPGGFLIYYMGGNQEIIYANKALVRMFQCTTLEEFRELTGNSFQGVVHPEDLEAVEQSIMEQITNSQYDLDYVEYRIIQKDGNIRWVEDYGHYMHIENVGDIFYVFIGDATEKRNLHLAEKKRLLDEKIQKEEKLKSLIEEFDKERSLINQEHLRRLEVIEGLSVNYESILYADLDADRILPYRLSDRTEKQFEKKFQMRRFRWYAKDYVDTWVHPEDQALVAKVSSPEYIRKRLAKSKTYYTNYRVINRGELQYLQLRIVNVGSRGRISQIVMGYRKVDEEVRQEMEQKQIFEDALNTANLAINAKNTFLSNMSHDMRTPLNAIFGYTALAKKYIVDHGAVEDYLGKIELASKQLLELIEKVLELSWAESNDTRISETECNLSDIVQDVHENLLPKAMEKNITFSLDSTQMTHYDIFGDQNKLRQLLSNLATNALTYTEEDGQVDISVKELEKFPNNFAVYQFIVRDTGIGISKDFLNHIFEPFEREKNTTSSGIHGTGLGLTIAKNLVDMMGGDIHVDSTPGKGSTFTVTLRFRIQTHPLSSANHTEDAFSSLLNKRILLVDDNIANLEIETEILQGMGFIVETAINGSIAVEKMELSSLGDYDLILMDIQMPVMNGWDATKHIRGLKDPALSRIPIIALSADAFDSDRQMSIECGMDAHLTKPIDVPLLLETIAKTLHARKYSETDGSKQR